MKISELYHLRDGEDLKDPLPIIDVLPDESEDQDATLNDYMKAINIIDEVHDLIIKLEGVRMTHVLRGDLIKIKHAITDFLVGE